MDIITKEVLQNILTTRKEWCISLFMPTHRLGQEMEQNPIRFKNLLREAEDRLLAKGLRAAEVQEILKAPTSLLDGLTFWQHQSDGLVLFFSKDELHLFRLPIAFTEGVFVSDRFHIKPLLPHLNSDGTFHVLAISQNQIRLFEGNKQAIDEIDLVDTPETLAESFPDDWPKQKFQFQTLGSAGAAGQGAATHAHATGTDVKLRLQKWFRIIDREVTELLADTNSPLILAGVDTLFPLYKGVNTYPNLIDEGIAGNPDEMEGRDFHKKAWAIVGPKFTKDRELGLEKYRQLAGTGKTAAEISETVLAAFHGRVETLFVALGVQVWGSFDSELEKVHIHEKQQPGDEDLLDLAAIQTLIKGGSVFALPPKEIPSKTLSAAVLRY